MSKNAKGFFLGILGVFFYSLMLVLMKLAQSVSPEIIAFSRIIGLALFTLPFVIKTPALLKTSRMDLHLVRVLCFFIGNFCVWYSLSRIYLVNISLLVSATPLMVPLLTFLFFKKTIGKLKLITIMIGFIGTALIINPQMEPLKLAHLLAFILPVTAAVSILSINKLSEKDNTITILFYYSVLSSLLSFLVMVPRFHAIDPVMWFYLGAIAISSTLFQLFTTKAYAIGNPQDVSPVIYFDVIFCSLFGWGIWGENLTPVIFFGSFMIILAGLYIIFENRLEPFFSKRKDLSS